MSDEEAQLLNAKIQDDDGSLVNESDEGEDIMNEDGDLGGSRKGTDDSSEEEEDDPEEARRIAEGFIVDEDDDEEEQDSDASGAARKEKRKKRKKRKVSRDDEDEDVLDEDDLELVAENTGRSRNKDKHRLKRFRRGSATPEPASKKTRDLSRIFEDSDDDELPSLAEAVRGGLTSSRKGDRAADYADDDDLDDFIDDDDEELDMDEDEREQRRQEKREQKRRQKAAGKALGMDPSKIGFDRESWEVLHEVFGRGDDYEWAMEAGSDEEDEEAGGKKKMTVKEIFEPAQIAEKMLTERDELIKQIDIPERFQLALPAEASIEFLEKTLTEDELNEAAFWVSTRISQRTRRVFIDIDGEDHRYYQRWWDCVKSMVELILNHGFEAPYLIQHKMDELELRTQDRDPSTGQFRVIELLRSRELHSLVDASLKFKVLLARRASLREVFKKLHALEFNISDEDADNLRQTSTGERFETLLASTSSLEEVSDLTEYLALQHGQKMRDAQALSKDADALADDVVSDLRVTSRISSYKKSGRQGEYERLKSSSVSQFTERFGLTVDQLGENLIRGESKLHFAEDEGKEPLEIASEYANVDLSIYEPEAVLEAGKTILVTEIGKHPLVRKIVREYYQKHAIMTVEPTERGLVKIDEQHPFFNFKYLKAKGVDDILYQAPPRLDEETLERISINRQRTPLLPVPSQVQYLLVLEAQSQTLVKATIALSDEHVYTLTNRIADAWISDGLSTVSQAWNELRRETVKEAVDNILVPLGNVWVREWLREECCEWIARQASSALATRINTAPYQSQSMQAKRAQEDYEEEEDFDANVPKVMAVAQGDGDPRKEPVRCVLLDSFGRLRRTRNFAHLREPPKEELTDSWDSRRKKESTEDPRKEFLDFVKESRPDVIVIGGFTARCVMLRDQIRKVVTQAEEELMEEEDLKTDEERSLFKIDVIHAHDDVARLYRHSKRAREEFPELSEIGRYCLALARYVQSPIQEFAALGEDLTAINFYEHQRLAPNEMLRKHLNQSLITYVNDLGVDLQRALQSTYYQNLLQYVAGFGPRKALGFIRSCVSNLDSRVVSRQALLDRILGPKVWSNAASFLKIAQDQEDDDDDDERSGGQGLRDVLDSTRIHPEDYDYARKMAADALGKDEEDIEGVHPSLPCKELMELDDAQAKLGVLDLENYASMLETQHGIRKRNILHLCSEELVQPYRDLRAPFILPTLDEILTMFTGETKKSIDLQLVVAVTIMRIVERVPDEEKDLHPYPYLAVRMECGLEGSIHAPYAIADYDEQSRIKLSSRYRAGQPLNALVIAIDLETLSLELSANPEHFKDGDSALRMTPVDPRFFDVYKNENAQQMANERRSKKAGTIVRLIKHPLFHHVKAGKAEEMLANEPDGAIIIRPSSRGNDHLAVTWRVAEGVYQHIDVKELNKENEYTIGRMLRVGETASFSDLDELIVRHIEPMHRKVQDLMQHEKYKGEESELNNFLTNFCLGNPTKSQYGFALDRKHPGYFKLMFKSGKDSPIQSWAVKVEPDVYVMNNARLPDVLGLCNAFKTQYIAKSSFRNDNRAPAAGMGGTLGATPIGGRTPGLSMRTPFGTLRTPAFQGGKTPIAAGLYGGGKTPLPYDMRPPGAHPGPPPRMPGAPPMPPPGPPGASRPAANIHPSRLQQMGWGNR